MASMLATVMLLGFFAVGSPLTMQRVEAAGIDMTNAFYITGNPADISQYTTVNANSISLGNTTGPYYNNVWQVVAATSKFKIDWTRSFSMVGFMVTPKSADQMMFGFHTQANRPVSANGTSAGYADGEVHRPAENPQVKVASPGLANSMAWYVNSYVNKNGIVQQYYADTKDVGSVLFDASGYPHWWANDAALTTGTWAVSKFGVDATTAFNGTSQSFAIIWRPGSDRHTGTLNIFSAGKSKTIYNLDIYKVFGTKAAAQATYFEMAASINQASTYNNYTGKAAMALSDFSYYDLTPADTVSYSVVRNGSTVSYNASDKSTWPVPGETVTVTHTITNTKSAADVPYTVTVPIRVSTATYGGSSDTIVSGSLKINGAVPTGTDIFNGATDTTTGLKKTVNIDIPKNGGGSGTVQYQVTLPSTFSTQGSVFKDEVTLANEGMTQYTLGSTANIGIPVCKIGSLPYYTLQDALKAIKTASNTSDTIQMLAANYAITDADAAEWNNLTGENITITTAASTDAIMPYRGAAGTKAALSRSTAADQALITVKGTNQLTLDGIAVDGGKGTYSSVTQPLIAISETGKLTLNNGAVLQNNNGAGAIVAGSGTVTLNSSSILQNNNGAGATVAGSGAVTLNSSTVTGNKASGVELVNTASALVVSGSASVTGNTASGSASPANVKFDQDSFTKIKITSALTGTIGVTTTANKHVPGTQFATGDTADITAASVAKFVDDLTPYLPIAQNRTDVTQIEFQGATFTFTKVDADNTATVLAGVQFKLYKKDASDAWVIVKDAVGADRVFTSDANGVVTIDNMGAGNYKIDEVKTALGYQLPHRGWTLAVTEDATSHKLVVGEPAAETGTGSLPPAFMKDGTTYKLPNIKLLALPIAGFKGITPYLAFGGALMGLAALAFFISRKKMHIK